MEHENLFLSKMPGFIQFAIGSLQLTPNAKSIIHYTFFIYIVLQTAN